MGWQWIAQIAGGFHLAAIAVGLHSIAIRLDRQTPVGGLGVQLPSQHECLRELRKVDAWAGVWVSCATSLSPPRLRQCLRAARRQFAGLADQVRFAREISREQLEFLSGGGAVALPEHADHQLILRLRREGLVAGGGAELAEDLDGAIHVAQSLLGVDALLQKVRGGLGAARR
jgi:hypothetical protein